MPPDPRWQTFERDIQIATAGLSGPALDAELARVAQQELSDAIMSGEGSPVYDRYVNGVHGAPEASVKAPGPILYVFSWWEEVLEFALDFLRKRSPVLEGHYQRSHVIMLGGQVIAPGTPIAADETVHVVNTQPYSRKIEVGHMRMSVERGVYDDARRAVRRRFAFVDVKATQILLPNGYILKGVFRKGYRPNARTGLKKDTRAGERMTYPALEMRVRAN